MLLEDVFGFAPTSTRVRYAVAIAGVQLEWVLGAYLDAHAAGSNGNGDANIGAARSSAGSAGLQRPRVPLLAPAARGAVSGAGPGPGPRPRPSRLAPVLAGPDSALLLLAVLLAAAAAAAALLRACSRVRLLRRSWARGGGTNTCKACWPISHFE